MLLRSFVFLSIVAVISGQRRYYSLHDMPETNFDCRDKILGGYYADPETNCQMFHVCVKIPGQGVQDFRFLCPNETSFDQENQICADSGDIDCEAAGLYLENFDLYRLGSAQAAKRPLFSSSKGTVVPLGPSTKSPILTNNINEDDEFFLQRSDTGDRRLHSKDLLRGSSSSNFFNNRNKGKDLEDDDDEENIPKTNNDHVYRPRSSHPVRGKSQYSSQFRKTETTSQPQPSTQKQAEVNPNQINDKKRTKIAVRKLTRKRPQSPEESQNLKTTSQPNYSSFTTQVTQKFNFGDQESRYNTINRVSTTPSTISTQSKYQSNFRAKTEPSSSTLAFFEASPTPQAFPENRNDVSKQVPQINFQSKPIVAAAVPPPQNFQNNQNRPATNFQPPFKQTTVNTNNQSPSQNFQQNKPTTPTVNVNYQPNRQNAPVNNNNFQQSRPNPTNNNFQQRPTPQPQPLNNNNNNFQQRPSPQPQQQRPSPQPQQQRPSPQPQQQRPSPQPQTFNNNNNNFQQNRLTTPGNFQPSRQTQVTFQPSKQTPSPNNQNFQQRSNQPTNNINFQQNRSPAPAVQNRPTTVSISTAASRAQTINNALQSRPTASPQNLRQYYNRQFDDFEEGDNQEFLKTAPSSNFRPSDLNSFKNNYKTDNFDKNNNVTKFAPTSTTKYYTPTIITTPKTSPTFSTKDSSVSFHSTNNPSNFYTPTGTSTTKLLKAPSSTLQPPTSGGQPRPFSSTPNQPITSSAKPTESKDASYDYAYYDDAGSFSEYDALDALGETDFTRTSQRTKSRLI